MGGMEIARVFGGGFWVLGSVVRVCFLGSGWVENVGRGDFRIYLDCV